MQFARQAHDARGSRLRIATVVGASLLVLLGCADGDEEEPGDDPVSDEEPAEEADDGEETVATEEADDEAAGSEDDSDDAGDDADPDTGGTVTVDGLTSDLDDTFWCNLESEDGVEGVGYFGLQDGLMKILLYQETLADGTTQDSVTIYPIEEIEHSLGDGSGTVSVEEGADGYPYIEVDGSQVVVDGQTDVAFGAEFTIPGEEGSSAFCDR